MRAVVGDRELHLWRIALSVDDGAYCDMPPILAQSERERAERYHFDIDRRRFVIARASLRQILGRYVGVAAGDVALGYGAYGKPLLTNDHGDGGIRFNLSHSADIALCAIVQRADVGVDVEQVRREMDVQRIAAQFFSPDEQRLLLESSDQHETFARIWARKEAYVKATGDGIGTDLQGFSVSLAASSELRDPSRADLRRWTVREIAAPSGYAAAVVSSEPLKVTEFRYAP